MTSKNSFLFNLRINARRRTWNTALFAVGFFFLMPVSLMLNLSSTVKYSAEERLAESLIEAFRNVIVMNPFILFAVTIFAMIAAIHGFSYLYSKKKTDLYLSVPVTIEKRFAAIFVNSVLMFVVPYIICLVISLLIAGTYGINDTYIIKMAFAAFGLNLLYYLAVYAVTAIAVMLTGNLPVTVLGACTLLGYENGIRLLISGMFSTYFFTYSSYSDEILYTTWLSPVGVMLKVYSDFSEALYAEESVGNIIRNGAVHMIVLAAVFMVIAFLLYKIRPSESCQKSMAFVKTKTTIKRLIMVPSALIFGLFFESASGNSFAGAVFGIAAGIFLSHAVIQAIYELDLKAVFKDKRSVIYAGIAAAVIFSVFRFDMLGYDRYVPDANKLESGAISLNTPFGNSGNYYDENYDYLNNTNYIMENMNITDTGILTDLAYTAQAELNRDFSPSRYDNNSKIISATVRYTMKNGKSVYRNVKFDYEKNQELMNRIFADTNFKENYSQLYDTVFDSVANRMESSYSNGFKMTEVENRDALIEAYRKDFMAVKFSDIMEKPADGYIDFSADFISGNNNKHYLSFDFPVYDSFENTVKVLEAENIDLKERISPEDVYSITVYNYNSEREPVKITDNEQIEEVIASTCTREQNNYGFVSLMSARNYDVDITILDDGSYGPTTVSCFFKEGMVPDFVK